MKKSDIARQFELPERQSKLVTMLREEGLRDEQVYCICRSTDVSRFMIGCDQCEEWYHGDCINVTEQESAKIRKFYCQKCRAKHPNLEIKYKIKKRHHSHSKHHPDDKKHDRHSSHKSKKEKRREKCGECEACYIKEDCGRCEPCKDKPKCGGPGVLGQKCKKRQCINFFHLAKKHGSHSRPDHRADHTYNTATPVPERPIVPKRDVEILKSTGNQRKRHISEDEWQPKVLKDKNDVSDPEDVWIPKTKKESKPRKKKDTQPKKKLKRDSSSDSDDFLPVTNEIRQCNKPACVLAAKPGSKYCSEECGLKLAEERLYGLLPQRIQEWKMTPCVAEKNDRVLLENIRKQIQTTTDKLMQLLAKHKELDALLLRVKAVTPNPEADLEDDDTDYPVYCVTCGHEVPSKRAIKHMHHCYNKLESQMTFGSMFKTYIEGNMFCDFYNPVNRSYCKRLRVMCPEHVKEPKISNNEVCGFPLTKDLFDETNEVCRATKKKCIRHYCWDKLRRANIDMERVGLCLKVDELNEKERQIRQAITNRAGVLGLMLHSTYNHHIAHTMQQLHGSKEQQPKKEQKKPQSDHHYHRDAPVKTVAKTDKSDVKLHDHQYFSSHQKVDNKKHYDHLYYSNK